MRVVHWRGKAESVDGRGRRWMTLRRWIIALDKFGGIRPLDGKLGRGQMKLEFEYDTDPLVRVAELDFKLIRLSLLALIDED